MFGFFGKSQEITTPISNSTPARDGDDLEIVRDVLREQQTREEQHNADQAHDQYVADGALVRSGEDGPHAPTANDPEPTREVFIPTQLSYGRILRDRDEVLHARTETLIALQKASQLREFALESQHHLLKYIRDQFGGNDNRVVTLYNKAQADANALNAQAVAAGNLERKLMNLEFHIHSQELDFSTALTSALKESGVWGAARLDMASLLEEPYSGGSRPESPTLDPLLEQYYGKAGHVNILGEEVADLDMEFRQAADRRELLADQGRAPSRAVSVYEREYVERRQDLSNQLSQAIEAVEQAKRECIAAGIDPAKRILVQPDSDTSATWNDPLSPRLLPLLPNSPVSPVLGDQALGMDEPPASQIDSQVLDWVDRVANSGGETPFLSISQQDVAALRDFRHELDTSSYVAVRRMRRNSSRSHQRRKDSGVMEHLQAT